MSRVEEGASAELLVKALAVQLSYAIGMGMRNQLTPQALAILESKTCIFRLAGTFHS